MSEKWYLDATKLLELKITEKNRINGMDFLQDFCLSKRNEFFYEIDFDDIDEMVSHLFEPYQSWLGKENYDWLTISPNGKWRKKKENKIDSITKSDDIYSLSGEDYEFINQALYSLEKDMLKLYLSLYSKLKATNLKEETLLCAIKIAECACLDINISLERKAEYWENAAKEARKQNSKTSLMCFQSTAKIYQKDMNHFFAASNYYEAAKLATDIHQKIDLIRTSRIQYELYGDHNKASELYIEEKDFERNNNPCKYKKLFLSLYKFTSGYGEEPKLVGVWAMGILLFSTLLTWCLGLNYKDTVINGFWDSLYFSIVTFTTLGYRDYTPVGFLGRVIAGGVSVSGLIFTSLFMVTVVRKYSRA